MRRNMCQVNRPGESKTKKHYRQQPELLGASALAVEGGRRFGMGATLAVFGMAFSTGITIGPILSGVLVDLVNINAVFYIRSCHGAGGGERIYVVH